VLGVERVSHALNEGETVAQTDWLKELQCLFTMAPHTHRERERVYVRVRLLQAECRSGMEVDSSYLRVNVTTSFPFAGDGFCGILLATPSFC